MGSGAIGEAALLEGRRFVGIEIEQKFFEIAKKRLEYAEHSISLLQGRGCMNNARGEIC